MITLIILSLIQGITELLPVSSSAHLIILPWFFKINDPGLAFDVALHLGTLLALIVYFFKDWLKIIKLGFNRKIPINTKDSYDHKTLWFLILATLPITLIGLVFGDKIGEWFRHPLITALGLIVFGILLWLSDKYSQKTLTVKDMNGKQALFIGMAQTLALIPGVSRSGATLTAALSRNFKRESAARFSLLLSMPAILGAAILEIKNLGTLLSGNLLLAIGIAALSSYLAIKLFMNYISKIGYKGFAIYRIILALAIIITYFIRLS